MQNRTDHFAAHVHAAAFLVVNLVYLLVLPGFTFVSAAVTLLDFAMSVLPPRWRTPVQDLAVLGMTVATLIHLLVTLA